MDTVKIPVLVRENKKAKDLLREDMIPAVFYGRGIENKNFQIDYQTFRKAFRVAGASTVVQLEVDGKEKLNALVHHVDYDPITDKVTHIDFINVRMDEEITTEVPLEFIGVAPAVKELAGTFVANLDTLHVRCLPKDLPHVIEVSIESLIDFHSSLHVSDIKLSDKVTVLNDPEELVANVSAPREEKEEVAAEGDAIEKAESSDSADSQ